MRPGRDHGPGQDPRARHPAALARPRCPVRISVAPAADSREAPPSTVWTKRSRIRRHRDHHARSCRCAHRLAADQRLDGLQVKAATLEDVFLTAPDGRTGMIAFRAVACHPQGIRPRPGVGLLRHGLPADVPGAFGGLFSYRPSRSELSRSVTSRLIDGLPGCEGGVRRHLRREPLRRRAPAMEEVRKGDADVAVEQQGDTLVAHYTDRPGRGGRDVWHLARVRRRRQRRRPGAHRRSTFHADPSRTTRCRPSSSSRPGLLGWAVAMSSAFGAAATLQGGGRVSCCAGCNCPRSRRGRWSARASWPRWSSR